MHNPTSKSDMVDLIVSHASVKSVSFSDSDESDNIGVLLFDDTPPSEAVISLLTSIKQAGLTPPERMEVLCHTPTDQQNERDESILVISGSANSVLGSNHGALKRLIHEYRRDDDLFLITNDRFNCDEMIDCEGENQGMIKLHNNKNYRYPAPKKNKRRNQRL
jgi:hypothetical protein